MFLRHVIAIVLLSAGFAFPLHAGETGPSAPARKLLLEREVAINGGNVSTHVLRVTLPPGYKTPLHTHEGPGPRYVLKGRIKIEESGQAHVYGVGDAFWETGQWMTAENVGEGEAEMVIVELAPAKR
jgi:quercetin dioxygenase-like cupin family protein